MENEKYWGQYKIDKENDNTIYSDERHIYIDKNDNSRYTSVTTLIGLYCQDFDEEFWSAYKAAEFLMKPDDFDSLKTVLLARKKFDFNLLKKYNIDKKTFEDKQCEIKNSYELNRNESCERGTKIHSELENSFYNRKDFDFSKYGWKDLHGQFDCKKNYYKLDLEKGVYPEFLVSLVSKDNILKIAGQIDLLVKDGNDISIIDWKSSKEIKKKSYYNKFTKKYQMMKYPLNNLMDTNFYHYSLQISTYAYLLQQINPDFNIKRLEIVHIDHDSNQHEYPVDYLKNDVIRMLKHYKKQLIINNDLNRLNFSI